MRWVWRAMEMGKERERDRCADEGRGEDMAWAGTLYWPWNVQLSRAGHAYRSASTEPRSRPRCILPPLPAHQRYLRSHPSPRPPHSARISPALHLPNSSRAQQSRFSENLWPQQTQRALGTRRADNSPGPRSLGSWWTSTRRLASVMANIIKYHYEPPPSPVTRSA